jgi:hypothetical protein
MGIMLHLRVMAIAVGSFALGSSAIATPALAAGDVPLVWQGAITIQSLSSACDSVGFSEGQLLNSVYRPRLQPSEPLSAVTILNSRTAQIYFNDTTSPNDQMIGRGNFLGHYIDARARAVPNSKASVFSGRYNFKVKPRTITASTGSITISGQLTNFFGHTGCTVNFLAAYQPRGN